MEVESDRCENERSCSRKRPRIKLDIQRNKSKTHQQHDRYLTQSELSEMNSYIHFETLTEEKRDRIVCAANERFTDRYCGRHVCLISDRWYFASACKRKTIDELPLIAMKAVLHSTGLSSQLCKLYDCSDLDVRLEGMLLSRRSFEVIDDGTFVWIENEAYEFLVALENQLSKGTSKQLQKKRPPRFAIADGFAIGQLDVFSKASMIEIQTVALAQVRGKVDVVYGGPGNKLRSHLLCWDNREGHIMSKIPNAVTARHFEVILVGDITTAQKNLLLPRHQCRVEVVRAMERTLREINPLYSNIAANDSAYDTMAMSNVPTEVMGDEVLMQSARDLELHLEGRDVSESVDNELILETSETILVDTNPLHSEAMRSDKAIENILHARRDNQETYGPFVAQRSTKLLNRRDKKYLEMIFPHLFPFGVGGLSERRINRYSQRDIICYYLNLSSNRFAEDPMFKLVMYDYLATLQVLNGVYVYASLKPQAAMAASVLTYDELQIANANSKGKRDAAKKGKVFVPKKISETGATVLQAIKTSSSKMWGSNEERDVFARKVSAICVDRGSPSLFWTFTPKPDNSILVAFWLTNDFRDGKAPSIDDFMHGDMPAPSATLEFVNKNAVAQAVYYWYCVDVLMEFVFGWDLKANKCLKDGGIFGHIEQLYFGEESQGRLTIHHHGVAWIAGTPRTVSDWDAVRKNVELEMQYKEYAASVFAVEFPIFQNLERLPCLKTDCDGTLEASKVGLKYRHLLKKTTPEPVIARCPKCDTEVTNTVLLESILAMKESKLTAEERLLTRDKYIRDIQMRAKPFSEIERVKELQMTKTLMENQTHSYYHVPSCVKKQGSTLCRYRFPRNVVETTGFDKDGVFRQKLRPGNQWLNGYVPTWREVFRDNMDATLIFDGEGPQKCLYCTKYATKHQMLFDNVHVIEMAMKKRIVREQSEDRAEEKGTSKGMSRLMSLAYASSGSIEIGGPLAAHYILRGKAAYFSCEFAPLLLNQALNILENKDVQVTIENAQTNCRLVNVIADYVFRPTQLEQTNWVDFVSWYMKKSKPKKLCSDDLLFLPQHPDVDGKVICRLEVPKIPDIIGPRLPDNRMLDDADVQEQYYRCALCLYKPFRSLKELFQHDEQAITAQEAFILWMQDIEIDNVEQCAKVRRKLEFHQQYYLGIDNAKQFYKNARAEEKEWFVEDTDIDENAALRFNDRENDRESTLDRVATHFTDMWEYLPDEISTEDVSFEENSECEHTKWILMQVPFIIPPAKEKETMDNTVHILGKTATLKQIKAFAPLHTQSTAIAVNEAHQTYLLSVCELSEWQSITREIMEQTAICPTIPTNTCPSLNYVCGKFNLNSLQRNAFLLMSLPLIYKFLGKTFPGWTGQQEKASPVFVTGAGGTGKSRIFEAIRFLAQEWDRPNAVAFMGTTGIAAMNIGGSTQHSFMGLPIASNKLPGHLRAPSPELLQKWAEICMVLLDEISMEGK